MAEHPILFDCEGDQLVGLLSLPEHALDIGVVVVVGGPQYRVGSHRQFVFLTRSLANEGIPCLRFDYRGMGDSEGRPRSFESTEVDIASAVRELMNRVPCVRHVVLYGLCDGASAALIALGSLPTVAGVIALNPWVRNETSLDQALVRHYYVRRVLSREFWVKLFSGKLGIVRAMSEFLHRMSSALAGAPKSAASKPAATGRLISYQNRMCDGLLKQRVPALIILSGRDLTAQEYMAYATSDPRWKQALADSSFLVTEHLEHADHTFSNEKWRTEVERLSCGFVQSLRDRISPLLRDPRKEA